MSLSLFDMPKLPGTAKLLKNDDFCVVHFNQTILCRSKNKKFRRSLGLLLLGRFIMPKPCPEVL